MKIRVIDAELKRGAEIGIGESDGRMKWKGMQPCSGRGPGVGEEQSLGLDGWKIHQEPLEGSLVKGRDERNKGTSRAWGGEFEEGRKRVCD